ncbi:MAG: DUF3105 domain-containing protein [Actinobacteria bacterium]|nr:DUF3105 domain-containing protein [Actinomycetota bacterium]
MAKKRRKPSRPRNRPSRSAGTGTVEGQAAGSQTDDTPSATAQDPAPRSVARSQRPSPTSAGQQHSRAEKKELARAEREAVRKQIARAERRRRLLWAVGIATVVGVGAYLILNVASPGEISAQAQEVAQTAGCGEVQTPVSDAPGGQHLASGESAGYTQRPATSGSHDPSPLPNDPPVHTEPIRDENAVHNLEHGYVILYYRADDPGALGDDVVARLASIAEQEDKVLVAPHANLNEGTSLAIAAWNKLWECPAGIGADDAATLANAFIEAYRGTSNAPEPNAP